MDGQRLNRVFEEIKVEYLKACRKHPTFPVAPALTSHGWVAGRVIQFQHFNDSKGDADTSIMAVQSEEMYEAIEAAMNRDWLKAREETLHLIATAIRAIDVYDRNIEKEGAK